MTIETLKQMKQSHPTTSATAKVSTTTTSTIDSTADKQSTNLSTSISASSLTGGKGGLVPPVIEETNLMAKMAQLLKVEVALPKALHIYHRASLSKRKDLVVRNRRTFVAACLLWAIKIEHLPVHSKMMAVMCGIDKKDLEAQYKLLNTGPRINYSERALQDKKSLEEKYIYRFINDLEPPLLPQQLALVNNCVRHLLPPTTLPPSPFTTSSSSSSANTSTSTLVTSPSPGPSMLQQRQQLLDPVKLIHSTSRSPWATAAGILYVACNLNHCKRSIDEIAGLGVMDPSTVRTAASTV